jgi:hypothetical protein
LVNIFVLKLNTNGAYQWNTFYGGYADSGQAIAVDSNDSVYVTGISAATWGIPLNTYSSGAADNIIVLKVNGSGTYQWHTFYGASTGGYDVYSPNLATGIALDGSDNIYVKGESGATWGNPLHAFGDAGFDLFIHYCPVNFECTRVTS